MKARHPIVRGIVSLLLVSLLAGCAGSGAKSETEAVRTGPEVTQIGPGPVAQEQPGFDLEALSGLWVMQEVEAEGDRVSAELAGLSVELLLREDSTADYIELTAAGESTEHLNLILDGDGDGRLDFSYEGAFGQNRCVITAADGDTLELSTEWTGPDGTPGGNTMYFRRGELDARGRRLYAAELEKLTESVAFDFSAQGFFTCTYDRPEEIDWSVVCRDSSSISGSVSREEAAAYQERYGKFDGELIAVDPAALSDFVWEKTQTQYSEARKPLWASDAWLYLDGYYRWCLTFLERDMQPIVFTDGYANGNEYYLYYTRSDWDNYIEEREFVMHCYIRDREWQYLSNLPADAPAPVPLLHIEFFDTKEEAQSRGAGRFVEVEQRPYDEPYGWCWAVVTAQTDHVRYIVDRVDEAVPGDEYGTDIPGENITSGVLDTGESFALYVGQPWHPAVLLTAAKDDFWGEYAFGEDNWLHLDNSVVRYVTGHDLQGEGRGCSPADEHQMARFLMDGDWVYRDEATGAVLAVLRFEDYQWLSVMTRDEAYSVHFQYEYYNTSWATGAPDVLRFEKGYAFETDWSTLPSWHTGESLGYYFLSAVQLDGEQILYLTQLDDSDGVLSYLLSGTNETRITLHRYQGTAQLEGQG